MSVSLLKKKEFFRGQGEFYRFLPPQLTPKNVFFFFFFPNKERDSVCCFSVATYQTVIGVQTWHVTNCPRGHVSEYYSRKKPCSCKHGPWNPTHTISAWQGCHMSSPHWPNEKMTGLTCNKDAAVVFFPHVRCASLRLCSSCANISRDGFDPMARKMSRFYFFNYYYSLYLFIYLFYRYL